MAELVLSLGSVATVELWHLYDDYIILFLLLLEDFVNRGRESWQVVGGLVLRISSTTLHEKT